MLKQLCLAAGMAVVLASATVAAEVKTGTAPVNGLQMYYEIHGQGEPLVLLHGAYMSIPSNWDALLPTLSADRQVIAVELQGHGRTGDTDRPITYQGMADDVAGLLDQLGIGQAAVFGYSMGGGVALQLAIRHPDKVSRVVAASASYSSEGLPEGFEQMMATMTPEIFAGTPFETEYKRLAPHPENFPRLFEKLKQLDLTPFNWEADYKTISVPMLLVFGDADIITHAHMASMYSLLGGTENGDMNGLGKTQMLVLPGASHIGVMTNPLSVEILKAAVPAFLSAPMPPARG